jgi:hypothetical protein
MVLPKQLRLNYLADKILTLTLTIILALLLKILCVIKGEEVEITVKKASVEKRNTTPNANKIKEKSINPNDLISEQKVETKTESNLVTGTPSELKPEEILKNIFVEQKNDEIINNDEYDKSDGYSSDSDPGSEPEEVQERENHREIPSEIRTSHNNNSNNNNNNNSDIFPFEFHWKHGGQEVIVTGDFDKWQCTHKMKYNPASNDFVAVVDIDRTKQHEFKFVVDGDWQPNWDLPTRTDEHGYINNIIYAHPSDLSLSPEYKDYAAPFSQFTTAY